MLRSVTTDDGIAIAYGEYGSPTGEAVVLCHGLCASGRQFEADARFFAGLGYRVLVPDLRAHGRSGKPDGLAAADFTIPRLAADMVAMLDDAGVATVNWVGNSLGGIVSGVTAQLTTDNVCGRTLVAEMLADFDPHAGQAVASNVRRYDLIDNALSFEGPILMIRGGRDRAVNAALGKTLRAMQGRDNFTRVDVKTAAHCANLDAPEEVRQTLVDFWRKAA